MRKWASVYYANIRTRITPSCEKGKHGKVRPEVVHDAPSTRMVFTLSAPSDHGTRQHRFHLAFQAMSIFRRSSRLKADFVFCGPCRTWWGFNGDDFRFWSCATGLASSPSGFDCSWSHQNYLSSSSAAFGSPFNHSFRGALKTRRLHNVLFAQEKKWTASRYKRSFQELLKQRRLQQRRWLLLFLAASLLLKASQLNCEACLSNSRRNNLMRMCDCQVVRKIKWELVMKTITQGCIASKSFVIVYNFW